MSQAGGAGNVDRMTARRLRAVAVLVAVALLWLCAIPFTLVSADARVVASDVAMTVADVYPNTPAISAKPRPLTFTLTLTNTTGTRLSNVVIAATRADPIYNQSALDSALAAPKAPSDGQRSDLDTTTIVTLAPYTTVTATLLTTIATDPNAAEICECFQNAIFPIYFTASLTTDGATATLGTAQTYLPSFTAKPAATMSVGWLWPLLDRPHRLKQDALFSDDDLATELAPGGRLDNALTVLEDVSPTVAMTVVTDPDLIDSLAVMGTGYRVVTTEGTVAGQHGDLAKAWLARLAAVIKDHPSMELAFTPLADPAVESLSSHNLSWDAEPSAQAQQRVATALGISTTAVTTTDITWPVDERVSQHTLTQLVQHGTSTVVLNDRALTGATGDAAVGVSSDGGTHVAVPDALAALRTNAGTVTAAVTSTALQRLVNQIFAPGGPGLTLLPKLVAELAIRSITSIDTSHYVLLTAPRNLQVSDPAVAERAILATASTLWSKPVALREAVGTIDPVDHGKLASYSGGSGIGPRILARVHDLLDRRPIAYSLFADAGVAENRLGAGFVAAVQRCESTGLLSDRTLGELYVTQLGRRVDAVMGSVHLITPSSGRYTLASSNAKLPVTVVNTLDADVRIRINVTASSSSSGFTADDIGTKTIRSGQRVQLQIPTHVDRVGVISINVALENVNGRGIGNAIDLKVRSSALGTIGIVITVAAGIVLALAVLVRLLRRTVYRRRERAAGRTP